MLKIHGRKNSINVIKVLWCVGELDLEYERIDIGGAFGGNDQPEYLAKNPMGRVPTIEEDGLILWESQSIVRYLAAKHGVGTLYPEDPGQRAKGEIWMDWYVAHLHPSMTKMFWGLVRTAVDERDEDGIASAIEEAGEHWSILNDHLKDKGFVGGDKLTIGDIPVGAAAFRYYELVKERPNMPNLDRWYASLSERSAYRTHAMNPLS